MTSDTLGPVTRDRTWRPAGLGSTGSWNFRGQIVFPAEISPSRANSTPEIANKPLETRSPASTNEITSALQRLSDTCSHETAPPEIRFRNEFSMARDIQCRDSITGSHLSIVDQIKTKAT